MKYFSTLKDIILHDIKYKDIIQRIKILSDNELAFKYIEKSPNDTYEDIALQYYQDKNLYWLVMQTNLSTNPFYESGLNENELSEYVNDNYDIEKKKYYDKPSGTWIYESFDEYYDRIINDNFQNKIIRIIKKEYFEQIMDKL